MIYAIWLLLVLIATALLYIHRMYYTYDSKFLSMAAKFPGLTWLPFIGTAYTFEMNPNKMLSRVIELCKEYHPVSGHWFGPEFYVFVSSPRDVEVLLNVKTRTEKGYRIYKIMENCIGNGLIVSRGEKWKKHRKLMNPMFYSDTLKVLGTIFDDKARFLCDLLEHEVGKPHFNIVPFLEKCGMNIMIATTVLKEYESEIPAESDIFLEHFIKMRVGMVYRMTKPWLYPKFVYDNLPCGKEINASARCINKILRKMARGTRKVLQSKKPTENGGKFNGSFLEFMMQLLEDPTNKLTEEDVFNEMRNIVAAAFETSTAAMGFTLLELSRHTDIQEKIVDEIRQEFGSLEDKPITYENVTKLKYLDRVVKESLRLYPTIPYIVREVLEDVKLPSGYTIPRGGNALIVFYTMHRDPEMFPNPEKFDPDNFLPEKVAARPPFAYAPFSMGPRNCIGQKYAMLSMKTQLIAILRRFSLLPTNFEPELTATFGLNSANGISIGIKKQVTNRNKTANM